MAFANPAVFYRLYAAECIEIAQNVQDEQRRANLLAMGQAWLTLADQADKNRSTTLVYETPVRPGDRC